MPSPAENLYAVPALLLCALLYKEEKKAWKRPARPPSDRVLICQVLLFFRWRRAGGDRLVTIQKINNDSLNM